MENRLTKEIGIFVSHCDSSARLGIPNAFAVFMDLAAEHQAMLGSGIYEMQARGLFWVAAKTKLRFFRRPALMERVTAATWLEPPGRMRNSRDYLLTGRDGETLIAGRTEWAILDVRNGGLYPLTDFYPPEVEFQEPPPGLDGYCRFRDNAAFDGCAPFAEYAVCSTDIDIGGHMNNAAYVRMLAGAFSSADWDALDPSEAEVHYRASCYEGDRLLLQKRAAADGALELRAALPDGKTILLARLR